MSVPTNMARRSGYDPQKFPCYVARKKGVEMRGILIGAATLVLTACASTGDNRGWTGNGAMPFDHAVASCQIETQVVEGPAFEVCMASKGWTRPQR